MTRGLSTIKTFTQFSLNFVLIKKLGNMGWVAVFGVLQRKDKDRAPINSDVLQDNRN